jgi:hypothetical protein
MNKSSRKPSRSGLLYPWVPGGAESDSAKIKKNEGGEKKEKGVVVTLLFSIGNDRNCLF